MIVQLPNILFYDSGTWAGKCRQRRMERFFESTPTVFICAHGLHPQFVAYVISHDASHMMKSREEVCTCRLMVSD